MDNFDSIQKMIDEMNNEIEALRETYKQKTQVLFKKAFIAFFDKNPEVTAVSWHQYTPYFNDGDACVFSTYAGYASVTNAKDYENIEWGTYQGEDEGVWIDDPDYGNFNEELIPTTISADADALRKLLDSVPDDMYERMFGDHVIVTATREGFDVTEYHHD